MNQPPASSLSQVLATYGRRLTAAASTSPALDAELILARALGLTRNALLRARIDDPRLPVSATVLAQAETLLARRERHEPMAYILGRKEFFGRDFTVTPATLIPRPDTELLVETALDFARRCGPLPHMFADFGAGSGAIAITLALELALTSHAGAGIDAEAWSGLALDISPDALAVAAGNAGTLGVGNIRFLQADFREDLAALIPDRSMGLIVSNPPYIPAHEYRALAPDVRDFEPRDALTPGPDSRDGTEAARHVVREAMRCLAPGGGLFLEMGWNQGDALRALLKAGPWDTIRIHKDLAGHDRVIAARRAA